MSGQRIIMPLCLNWSAALRHPLSRERRREYRRQATRELEETRQQLRQAIARGDELEAAVVTLRVENAAFAERAAIAADVNNAATRVEARVNSAVTRVEAGLNSAVTRVEAGVNSAAARFEADVNSAVTRVEADLNSALRGVALADTVAIQLSDARDRLASRLELLTSEVKDVGRSIASAGGHCGSNETRRLYLDLLESTLTGVLTHDGNTATWGTEEFDPERRLYGRDWPKSAVTMIGTARMRNLRRLVETALTEGIAGDLLEAGVWRGGACIYMRGILAAHGIKNRTVWVADSFAGLPKPDETLYPADKGDVHHTFDELCVSLDEVKDNFERFGLLDDLVAFLPGWFKDTLPQAPIEQLAVLRLDGDMYGSTMETLQALYPRVSRGGFIIVDDYILPGCRQAVDHFREQRGINEPLHDVDGAAAYWKRA
jgi:hypothetical protein